MANHRQEEDLREQAERARELLHLLGMTDDDIERRIHQQCAKEHRDPRWPSNGDENAKSTPA
jgi:hypothetical protein